MDNELPARLCLEAYKPSDDTEILQKQREAALNGDRDAIDALLDLEDRRLFDNLIKDMDEYE